MTATDGKQLLRLATAGSVDDGKSTLIGRMLLDAKLLFDDTLDALHRNGENGAPDLAALTDGLRAEREQGITIDVAYRYFTTPRRSFIIADTPGHQRYTRNMVTGASTAHLAVILIDARNGIVEQSRRHATLSSLLGIRHLVAAVNKMDLVDWSEDRFREIEGEFAGLAEQLGVEDAQAFPISALHGDNVVERGDAGWYDGPPLLEHLEEIDVATHRGSGPFRLPVQWVIRPEDAARRERRYAGQVAGGTVRAGDEIVAMPSGSRTTVLAVETLDGPLESASPPDSVSVQLEHDLDVGRGEILCGADDLPVAGRYLEATVCWMSESPLRAGEHLSLKHTTRTVRAAVESIDALFDVTTQRDETPPDQIELNDIARLTLRTSAPVVADPYADNRTTGAFILIDEDSNDTVGAGMVRAVREHGPREQPHSPGVTWHESSLQARPALELAQDPRRHRVAHGPAVLGQVDHRRGARAQPRGGRARRLLPRRRQPAPRAVGRPGLLPRRPDGEHPPGRARRAADGGLGHGRDRLARLARPPRPGARARAAPGRGAAVHRGLRRHAGGDLRGARPEGPVRAGAGRQARGLHGRQRPLRAAAQPRRADPRRRGVRQGRGGPDPRGARASLGLGELAAAIVRPG